MMTSTRTIRVAENRAHLFTRYARRACVALLLLCATGTIRAQESWHRAGLAGRQISRLAVTGNGTVYAATSEGIFTSGDAGAHWTPTAITQYAWLVAAQQGGELLALYNSGSIDGGPARSIDGGATWTSVSVGDNIRTIVVDGSTGAYAGGLSDIFRTTDNGEHWSGLPHTGMDGNFFDYGALAVGPHGELLAGNSGITGGMIYMSGDEGETWLYSYTGGSDVTALGISPTGTFLACFYGKGLYRSIDGGGSWSTVQMANDTLNGFAFHDGAVYASARHHALRSTDDGASWTVMSDGLPPSTTVTSVVTLPDGTPVIGTADGVYTTGSVAGIDAGTDAASAETIEVGPNPARESAWIDVTIRAGTHLRAAVYDIRGTLVATIADRDVEPGAHRITWSVASLPTGMYRVMVHANATVYSAAVAVTR